ncbi:nitroreductase family protein [Ignatzschineria sp. RMDPL8A]|uniref:nitroreductase family protein n=1 Tax=Ignatzschineria sp. RMDPL8A TaxID=2999236 RepID=UPI0024465F38|nr:nitroreductase family protein [Ignatzschineria sp. RMDPL8A]MDG9730248.1 nitroreductase family protein [Ignatzschineria sp. RMDPL8A]
MSFTQLLKTRRSIYHLGKNVTMAPDAIEALVKKVLRESPSAFNSQSSRALVLLGEEHQRVWDIAKEILRQMVPAEAFTATETKLNSFAAGFGTVLFFEDQAVVEGLQEQFALYADNFPIWSEQASGMAQLALWLAFSEAGIGASLQHYNPLIDEEVRKAWDIPKTWSLRAQMPFGSIESPAAEKTFMDDDERVIVAGK